jgi:hypothetical protein
MKHYIFPPRFYMPSWIKPSNIHCFTGTPIQPGTTEGGGNTWISMTVKPIQVLEFFFFMDWQWQYQNAYQVTGRRRRIQKWLQISLSLIQPVSTRELVLLELQMSADTQMRIRGFFQAKSNTDFLDHSARLCNSRVLTLRMQTYSAQYGSKIVVDAMWEAHQTSPIYE